MRNAKKKRDAGVALQACIPLQQNWPQKFFFWIPSTGMPALRNARKCGVMAPSAHTSAHICPPKRFWIPRRRVFEMHNAKKCGFLLWRPKRAYLCTKSASEGGFAYLGWGRLKLRISNTPILDIQSHFCGKIWCRGMRAWSATPKPHMFGIAHFKLRHTRYPKTLVLADLMQRYARLERHTKPPHLFTLRSANTPILGIQKHLFWPIVRRGLGVWGATPEPHQLFWHCAAQTPPS